MQETAGGDPGVFLALTDALRGAREGRPDPRLVEALPSVEEQALADRYGWGADIARQDPMVGPLALLPPIAYEGVKAVAPGVLGTMGRFLPQGEEMEVDERTSPASWENVRALVAGYRDRTLSDLMGRYRKGR